MWNTSFSSNLGTTPNVRPLQYGGIGSRTTSILVNFGIIEGVNQEVLRRIACDVMRKVELYAWPYNPNSQSGETRKGGKASRTNRHNANELPDAPDLIPECGHFPRRCPWRVGAKRSVQMLACRIFRHDRRMSERKRRQYRRWCFRLRLGLVFIDSQPNMQIIGPD